MQRMTLTAYKTSFLLCLGNAIVLDAISAPALSSPVPEKRPSTWVCAFGGQTFGTVFDLGLATPAEVDGVDYFAHVELTWFAITFEDFDVMAGLVGGG